MATRAMSSALLEIVALTATVYCVLCIGYLIIKFCVH